MVTASVNQTYDSLPAHARPAALALSVLIDRIGSLGKADRDDLFALFVELRKAETTDETQEVCRAMEEILAQAPIRVRPLAPRDGESLALGLQKWAQHVGSTIKTLREKAGLNQSQLAKKSGLTQSHISRLENAQHSPTNFTLQKIANALGVSVRDIDPCVD